jgi:hypothetical protein
MSKHRLTPEHAERIDKWVEALESGRYKQGTGRLRDRDCYCCLGVLCDISGVGEWNSTGEFVFGDGLSREFEDAPPLEVAKMFGLQDVCASIVDGMSLIDFNDGTRSVPREPFPKIAARIRKWKAEECEVVQ